MTPLADVIRLNQYAQGVQNLEEGRAWFSGMDDEQRTRVLNALASLIDQAHPTPTEVHAAIAHAGLKPTYTPCVLILRGQVSEQLAKIRALPDHERDKAFALFVALLSVSDARRRRTECSEGCTHWWHQDLSSELVVSQLLEMG